MVRNPTPINSVKWLREYRVCLDIRLEGYSCDDLTVLKGRPAGRETHAATFNFCNFTAEHSLHVQHSRHCMLHEGGAIRCSGRIEQRQQWGRGRRRQSQRIWKSAQRGRPARLVYYLPSSHLVFSYDILFILIVCAQVCK